MAAQKFVFLDPATGLYKEQTSNDSIVVPNGVDSTDAVNKGQLDSVQAALQSAIDAEQSRAIGMEYAEMMRASTAEAAIAADLAAEVARATAAEGVLTANLAAEVSRAEAAELALTNDLAAEVVRATAAELALGVRIDVEEASRIAAVSAETARALAAEAQTSAELASEVGDRAAADADLQAAIDALSLSAQQQLDAAVAAEAAARAAAVTAEATRALAAEATLTADLAAEVTARGVAVAAEETRALVAEAALEGRLDILEADDTTVNSVRYLIKTLADNSNGALTAEIARAEAAEAAIAADLATEVSRATAAEGTLAADIAAEESRALAAESALSADIATEAAARQSSVSGLFGFIQGAVGNINAEVARATAAEAGLQSSIDGLTADLSTESSARIAGDAATLASAQAYADGIAQGLTFKDAVVMSMPVSFTFNGTQYNMPADFAALQAASIPWMDTGKRVLLTQTTSEWNSSIDAGIYVVQGSSLVRAPDMAVGSEANGAYVYVEWGDISKSQGGGIVSSSDGDGGYAMVCNAQNVSGISAIVGTNPLRFLLFSRAENLSFGDGFSRNGNRITMNLKPTGGLKTDWGMFGPGDMSIKIGDNSNLVTDSDGLKLQGSLVNGLSADSLHKHAQVTVTVASDLTDPVFVTGNGYTATYDAPDCVGFLTSGAAGLGNVVMLGQISVQGIGFSTGQTMYLGSDGTAATLCHYTDIPSGKYAIPVGKFISAGAGNMGQPTFALALQIGAALLKA